jgi:hypothetical protein
MRESFIFYKSFLEAGSTIENKNDRLSYYEAIFDFAINGIEKELKGVPKGMFSLVKPQLQANQKRWENGNKGGRKAIPKDNQKETKSEPNKNQKETKNEANNNVECINVECIMNNENDNSKYHSENEFSVIEKNENLEIEKSKSPENSFFKNFTKIWFDFHQEKYEFKPNFKSIDGAKINSIISKLKKIAEQKNFEFTQEIAEQSFLKFLNLAYSDDWLKSNFQLQILDSKFDSIIQKKINNDKGISNNKQQGNSAMATYKEQLINDLQGT